MFKNENRKSPRTKRLDFLFDVLLSKLPRTIFFPFLSFESHGQYMKSGKNLPIGSGTIFLEFIPKHGMLYIICKHFSRWFQKCKVYRNLMNISNLMKIFHFRGQNDNFAQKTKNMVMWRIIPQKINYLVYYDTFGPKLFFITTPSGENWNSQKNFKMTS